MVIALPHAALLPSVDRSSGRWLPEAPMLRRSTRLCSKTVTPKRRARFGVEL